MAMSVEELVAAMQQLVDAAQAADAPMSEEDVARYEELEKELARAQKTAELIKRQAAWKSVNVAPIVAAKAAPGEDDATRAFVHYAQTGQVNGELVRAQSEGVSSAGGFLVPESFRNKIVEKLKAYGGVAGGAEEITTATGEPMYWLTEDNTSNVGAITPEGASMPPSGGADEAFAARYLGAYKYSSGGAGNTALKVSYELLADSAIDLPSFLSRKLGERIGRQQAADLVNGTGVGQPTGLLSTAGGLAQTASWSSNSAPTYNDLVNFVHSLDPAYRGDGCVWVFNDATLKLIRQIKDGNNRPLFWDQSMNLSNGLTGLTLLGFPVIVDQGCASPSSANSFGFFGNLNQAYVIRRVKDVTMIRLDELYATSGQVGFLAWARMDAMVQDPNAGVLLKAA